MSGCTLRDRAGRAQATTRQKSASCWSNLGGEGGEGSFQHGMEWTGAPPDQLAAAITLPVMRLVVLDLSDHRVAHSDAVALWRPLHVTARLSIVSQGLRLAGSI